MLPRSVRVVPPILLIAAALSSACGKTPLASLAAADSGTPQESDRTPSAGGGAPDSSTPIPGDGDALPSPDSGCRTCNDAAPASRDARSTPDGSPPGDTGEAHDGGGALSDASPHADAAEPSPDGGEDFECENDDDCGFLGFFGHCEPTSHTCVECLSDQDCGRGRICDTQAGFTCRNRCFMGECGPIGVCDPSIDACVDCLADGDCDPDEVCDPSTKSCVECLHDADCALAVGRPVCALEQRECVECAQDSDCAMGAHCIEEGGQTFCAPPSSRELCEPCDTDQDCGGPNDLCIGYIGPSGLFDRACAIDCSANSPGACPSGFECVSVRMMSAMQCRPRYAMQTPTCEATRHLGLACPIGEPDPGCGIPGVQDARCVPASSGSGGNGVCTVWCNSNTDCKAGFSCVGAGPGQVGNCR